MAYYPIFLNLKGKRVLVVGGGKVSQRKVQTLLEYGAVIRLVAKKLTPVLIQLCKGKKIRYVAKEFQEAQLKDVFMVIGATDDRALNQKIGAAARERGLLVNIVDQPADCNFIVPAVVRRGDLQIAVSTSGRSPALAKKIRESLEAEFGEAYELLINLQGRVRAEVLKQGLAAEANQRIFQLLADSPLQELLAHKDWEAAAAIIHQIIPLGWSAEDIRQHSKFKG